MVFPKHFFGACKGTNHSYYTFSNPLTQSITLLPVIHPALIMIYKQDPKSQIQQLIMTHTYKHTNPIDIKGRIRTTSRDHNIIQT